MKKLIAILMALMLCLAGCALAEENSMTGEATADGSYVIRIPVEAGDEGWEADDMTQDDSVVKLAGAEVVDGVFTATYTPVADGEMSVTVKHMDGIACDEFHTFDLKVKDGAIEVTGGSYTAAPDEADLDKLVSGEWTVNDEVMAGMTITKNEGKGWSFQIGTAYPGVYVFQGNCYYDCELNEFVYDDATVYQSEITNTPEVKLGDVIEENVSGTFTLAENKNGFVDLEWYNSLSPDERVTFTSLAALAAMEEGYATDAGSDWYMAVLSDEAMAAEYPYHAFVDVNGDGVPALIISTTKDPFIGAEDKARLYLCKDGEAALTMEIGGNGGEMFYFNADEHTLTYYSRLSGEAHIVVYKVEDGVLVQQLTADCYGPHHYPEEDTDQQVYLKDGEKITEEEGEALCGQYTAEDAAVTYEA